jgi:thiol-disulfide isomerase/thioredoxin
MRSGILMPSLTQFPRLSTRRFPRAAAIDFQALSQPSHHGFRGECPNSGNGCPLPERIGAPSRRMNRDMRKLTLSALGALSLAASFTAAPAFPAQIPRKAPEFVIQMPDGKQDLLSSRRGKTVVLAFMFTTCPHCQKTAQILAQVQREYADKGVQVLGAAFDQGAPSQVQRFNQVFGVNFPCGYSDQKTVMDFLQITEPPFVPDLVFIDTNGMVRSQYVGDEKFLSNQEANIRAELEKMIKARPMARRTAAPPNAGH